MPKKTKKKTEDAPAMPDEGDECECYGCMNCEWGQREDGFSMPCAALATKMQGDRPMCDACTK